MSGAWQGTILDEQGNVVSGASVAVRHETSGDLATIYGTWDHVNNVLSDQLANPITTGSSGFVRFYATNGLYRILATKGGFTQEWRHVAIGLTITSELADDITGIENQLDEHAQEIADTVADVSRTGEVALHNLWRLFRLGRPIETYDQFELATRKVVLPSGVTLQTYFDTIETDTLLLGQTVSLLGAKNESSTAFILATSTVKIDSDAGVTLAEKFTEIDAVLDGLGEFDFDAIATAIEGLEASVTVLDGDIVAVASDVTLLDTRLTTAEGGVAANASALTTLNATVTSQGGTISSHTSSLSSLTSTVGGHTSSITTLSSTTATLTSDLNDAEADIVSLEAKYGVSLNVGGYITGFVQHNNGSSGTFDILTDKFRVVNPAGGGTTPRQVFTISGTDTHMQNVFISGSLLVAGSVAADRLSVTQLDSIVANTGTLNVDEAIKIGSASAFMTGTGLWEGMDSGTPKWRVGDPAGQHASWDGSTFNVAGDLQFIGRFTSLDDAAAEIAYAANTVSVTSTTPTWQTTHTFVVKGTGTIAVRIEAGQGASATNVRLFKNGTSEVGAATNVPSSVVTEVAWTNIAVAQGDVFAVQGNKAGGGSGHNVISVSVRARLNHAVFS